MHQTKLFSSMTLMIACSFLSACYFDGETSLSSSADSLRETSTASSLGQSESTNAETSSAVSAFSSSDSASSGSDASTASSNPGSSSSTVSSSDNSSDSSSSDDQQSSSEASSSSSSSSDATSSQGQTSSEPLTSSGESSSEESSSQSSSTEEPDHTGGGIPVPWFLVGSGSLWGNPWSDEIELYSNPNNPTDLAMYLDVAFCTGDLFKIRNDSNEWLGYERYANVTLLSFQQSGPSDMNIVCVQGGRFDIYLNSSKSIWIAAHAT